MMTRQDRDKIVVMGMMRSVHNHSYFLSDPSKDGGGGLFFMIATPAKIIQSPPSRQPACATFSLSFMPTQPHIRKYITTKQVVLAVLKSILPCLNEERMHYLLNQGLLARSCIWVVIKERVEFCGCNHPCGKTQIHHSLKVSSGVTSWRGWPHRLMDRRRDFNPCTFHIQPNRA